MRRIALIAASLALMTVTACAANGERAAETLDPNTELKPVNAPSATSPQISGEKGVVVDYTEEGSGCRFRLRPSASASREHDSGLYPKETATCSAGRSSKGAHKNGGASYVLSDSGAVTLSYTITYTQLDKDNIKWVDDYQNSCEIHLEWTDGAGTHQARYIYSKPSCDAYKDRATFAVTYWTPPMEPLKARQ